MSWFWQRLHHYYLSTDRDECADNNGGCSDGCVNFLGGYKCLCPTGLELDRTGKMCKGNIFKFSCKFHLVIRTRRKKSD